MSVYSGEFDFYDCFSFSGGYFDKNGNPVKFGQEGVSCYYSNELKDFEAFKKATDGKIYQMYKVIVSESNKEFVKENCTNFDFREVTNKVEDKRHKNGKKIVKSYIYTYSGKEYTSLKELNKNNIYITNTITFDTLLELIPYYPYGVSVSSGSEDKKTVYITQKPIGIRDYVNGLNGEGFNPRYPNWENKRLAEHYLEVCKNYYLYKLDERTKQIPIIGYKPLHNGYYELITDSPVDYMHEIKFVWSDGNSHSHYCSPKLSENESNVILISAEDIEYLLKDDIKNNTVKIEYVEKCEFPFYRN